MRVSTAKAGLLLRSALSGLVDGRVFALRATADTRLPYIVYTRTGTAEQFGETKDDPNYRSVSYDVEIYSRDYPESVDLWSRVEQALTALGGKGSLHDVELSDGGEGTSEDGNITVQLLSVTLIHP